MGLNMLLKEAFQANNNNVANNNNNQGKSGMSNVLVLVLDTLNYLKILSIIHG